MPLSSAKKASRHAPAANFVPLAQRNPVQRSNPQPDLALAARSGIEWRSLRSPYMPGADLSNCSSRLRNERGSRM
jgi:hypothetical protein